MGVDLARHWRLKNQRYRLRGAICHHCGQTMFPPRTTCPKCAEAATEPPFPFEVQPELATRTPEPVAALLAE